MVQERETLTGVDEQTRLALVAAADAYEHAPARLRAEIIAAARQGERPAAIVRAIGHVYTYDYVARLIRRDRTEHPREYDSA